MGPKGMVVKAVLAILTFVLVTAWMKDGLGVNPTVAAVIGAAAVFGVIVLTARVGIGAGS